MKGFLDHSFFEFKMAGVLIDPIEHMVRPS